MRKYDSYKDSGIEWIGEVPIGWNLKKLKELFENRNEKNEDLCEDFLSITKDRGVIPYSEKGNVGNKTSEDIGKYKKVYPEDIVVNPMNIIIGSVGVSKYYGVLSNVYIVLKPTKILSGYGSYIFHHKSFQLHLKKICYGIMELRESLNKIEFFVEKLPLPTLPEQQQIVSYLDRKTSQIDSLIEKTQRKIELLKEKRTSLINEVVTKGLNPNVEMKNSGVEWIGEIPSHWETPQIRYITEILRGKFSHRPRNDERLYEGIYPFIQTGDIVSSGKYLTKYTQTLNEWGYSVSKEFPIGTLVMTISGNIGDVSILKIKSCFPDSIIGFFPKSVTNEEFLFYMFTSLKQELIKNSTVSTQMNLNVERVGSIYCTLPPPSEQNEIVSYLDEHTQLIDKTISIEEKRIELLKEYRQSLISEVVTGKRKVVD